MKSPHPKWALDYKKPGTELRYINGRYYLYEVHSIYDKKLKRAKKITGKLLGRITKQDGFLQSDKDKLRIKSQQKLIIKDVSIREYGLTAFLQQIAEDIIISLERNFPDYWQEILLITYCRFGYKSCIKNMPFYLSRSFIQEGININLTDKKISMILRQIGQDRKSAVDYMKSFIRVKDHIAVDLTNIFSASKQIELVAAGYNSDLIFDTQFNLMYLYSLELNSPIFFRIYSGNVRDVKGFKLLLEESGIKDAIIIADKGFYSERNIEILKGNELRYLIPLRRNNPVIDYQKIRLEQIKSQRNYFKHESRYIWHYSYKVNDEQIHLYLDDVLKNLEESDYLSRIDTHPEEYTIEKYHIKRIRFGTICIMTNIAETDSEEIYSTYKSRVNIENMFDGMKNVLDNDKTYMQSEDALQGWMFINHISLQLYYKIYSVLKQTKVIQKYSINDIVIHLKEIRKIKINEKWILEPITSSTEKLLRKIGIHIT